jgi:hypothetical protein
MAGGIGRLLERETRLELATPTLTRIFLEGDFTMHDRDWNWWGSAYLDNAGRYRLDPAINGYLGIADAEHAGAGLTVLRAVVVV